MHRQADAVLARHGVTADQFVLMAALAEGDAHTQQDLVRRLSSDANTVRAMLLLLEQRGLVTRAAHPADKRARTVSLTPQGRRAFQKMKEASQEIRTKILEALGPERVQALQTLLTRVTEAMTASGELLPTRKTRKPSLAAAEAAVVRPT
jgi:DNA-binding MarR family transcriptional regulator